MIERERKRRRNKESDSKRQRNKESDSKRSKMSTTITQRLWNAASPLISVTEQHPFLIAMVDGSLDMNSFRYYAVQDALYLKDFASCLRRLGDTARSDAYRKRLHAFAKGAEEAEMSLHHSFFQQWDISADGVEQMPNCLLYTSYMERIVATKCHEEGLAVLLPCFWIYWHVGKCMLQLREDLGDTVSRPPQFDAWIDMYSSNEFETEVMDYIAMMEDSCRDVDETTLQEMEKHFVMSCKLEHLFWDQAQQMLEWPDIINNHAKSL